MDFGFSLLNRRNHHSCSRQQSPTNFRTINEEELIELDAWKKKRRKRSPKCMRGKECMRGKRFHTISLKTERNKEIFGQIKVFNFPTHQIHHQ